jgi:hypothetical protein
LVWRSIKGALSIAFKTFAGWFLDQWQALFNGVLSGIHRLLPHAFALKQMTFADDYRRRYRAPDQRDPKSPSTMPVAPPIHVHTTLQLDGRQIAQTVTRHQTQAAQRAAFSSGSQPDGSRYVYSPAQP